MSLEYSLLAHNTATASANKIHDDEVARRFGFRGGLVPGVDVYAYLTHPPAAAWGLDWLERGSMRARFLQPVYDGGAVAGRRRTVTAALELTDDAGDAVRDRRGAAAGRRARRRPTLPTGPPSTQRGRPADRGAGVARRRHSRSGSRRTASTPTAPASTSPTSASPCRSTRPRAWPIPGGCSATPTTCCRANVRLGPWIHVESAVQHFAARARRRRGRRPRPRDAGVGAQGAPIRRARRRPPGRRPTRRPHAPHRHLPTPRRLNVPLSRGRRRPRARGRPARRGRHRRGGAPSPGWRRRRAPRRTTTTRGARRR